MKKKKNGSLPNLNWTKKDYSGKNEAKIYFGFANKYKYD